MYAQLETNMELYGELTTLYLIIEFLSKNVNIHVRKMSKFKHSYIMRKMYEIWATSSIELKQTLVHTLGIFPSLLKALQMI